MSEPRRDQYGRYLLTLLLPTTARRHSITCNECRWHTVEYCPTDADLQALLDAHNLEHDTGAA